MATAGVWVRRAAVLATATGGGYAAGVAVAKVQKRSSDPPQIIEPLAVPSGSDHATAKPTEPSSPDTLAGVPEHLRRWYAKWSTNTLGWHLEKPHPVLMRHLDELLGDGGETQRMVLFPLCGASVDLGYVARRGHHVVGVEAVPAAVDRLLKEWGTEIEGSSPPPSAPTWLRVATPGWWQSAAAEQLSKAMGRVFKPAPFLFAIQGDFLRFDDQAAARYGFEQGFDAAFDRGSCVAVEPKDRERYAAVLTSRMAPGGRLLLVTVEHEPAFGPPYSVDEAEVRRLFEPAFKITRLSREDKLETEPVWRQRGATSFSEVVYMCERRGEPKDPRAGLAAAAPKN